MQGVCTTDTSSEFRILVTQISIGFTGGEGEKGRDFPVSMIQYRDTVILISWRLWNILRA